MELVDQLSEIKKQKPDTVPTCILTSVDSSRKAIIRQMSFLQKAWIALKETFRTMREASTDVKLAQLQSIILQKKNT